MNSTHTHVHHTDTNGTHTRHEPRVLRSEYKPKNTRHETGATPRAPPIHTSDSDDNDDINNKATRSRTGDRASRTGRDESEGSLAPTGAPITAVGAAARDAAARDATRKSAAVYISSHTVPSNRPRVITPRTPFRRAAEAAPLSRDRDGAPPPRSSGAR